MTEKLTRDELLTQLYESCAYHNAVVARHMELDWEVNLGDGSFFGGFNAHEAHSGSASMLQIVRECVEPELGAQRLEAIDEQVEAEVIEEYPDE